MIVIHEAGASTSTSATSQPLRQPRLRRPRRRTSTRAKAARRRRGDVRGAHEAALLDVRRRRVRGDLEGAADHLRARPGRQRQGRAASASAWAAAIPCCWPSPAIALTPPWTAGAGSSTAPRPRSAPPRSAPRPRSSWPGSCAARCWPPSGPRTRTRRRRSPSSCASAPRPPARRCEVDVYEGAGHAFFADYRPTYRPEPAARLWERIVPFLAAPRCVTSRAPDGGRS